MIHLVVCSNARLKKKKKSGNELCLCRWPTKGAIVWLIILLFLWFICFHLMVLCVRYCKSMNGNS
ncbi:hypothetical protein DM01DRAFT_1014640 [Hesseltinella vesiculosa]|uniref:Uncharacterized protein n=1 Tax=Hesseltinella vesiculosa TaxID=101127 RepID=A0A1X2GYX5_9FUNG|nr:hypothetical protein DM01DRAFT_1014640 [Hesseltinella vesiculosa]